MILLTAKDIIGTLLCFTPMVCVIPFFFEVRSAERDWIKARIRKWSEGEMKQTHHAVINASKRLRDWVFGMLITSCILYTIFYI